jgi:5'-nucleotidase
MYMDELIEVESEGGRVAYDIYNNPPGRHEEEGTDFAAVEAGEISVTPVHLQLTDHAGLEELRGWDIKTLLSENGSR